MQLIDFVFLTFYKVINRIRPDVDGSKFSSFLYTVVYIDFILISLICLAGLSIDNNLFLFYKQNPTMISLSIAAILALLFYFRYYRYLGISDIEESFNALSSIMKGVYKVVIVLLLILIPALAFIVGRLFIVGQLKWW